MVNVEQNFLELLTRVLNKALARESTPRYINNNEPLYRTELHVIDAVGSHPESNLTALAEILGVTKGAVSQKVRILEKKQYITRYWNPDNRKEVFFELTPKGKVIFDEHKEFHRQFNKRLFNALENIDEKDLLTVINVFKAIENHLETL